MSEAPADRFRRIIKAWREQEQGKQSPAVMYAPTTLGRAAQAAPRPVGGLTRPTGSQVQTARQPAAEPVPSPPEPVLQPTQPTPLPGLSKASQPVGPSVDATDEITAGSFALPDAQLSETPLDETPFSPSLELPPLEPAPGLDKLKTPSDAREFLERLRAKTAQVVQDYSEGTINKRQFEAIYSHYQRQRLEVEQALIEMPGSSAWRAAAVEGHTSFLRQQHAAQVLGYAIYEMVSGSRVTHIGDFDTDDALVISMLSSFPPDTQALFGAGIRHSEIGKGRWLCGVPGRYTTLVVIFSAEPATIQLQMIEDLHRDFEMVNETSLSSGDLSQLAFTFTHLWTFDQGPIER
jgi:hypothetical protein